MRTTVSPVAGTGPSDPPRLRRAHRLPQGAELGAQGAGVHFRLWAPGCERIGIELTDRPGSIDKPGGGVPRRLDMTAVADGWHELTVPGATAGTRYQFILPDGSRVPDPASRFQPDDVQGSSEVIDPQAYVWEDGDWCGRPWHEAVVYELHIGAFTRQGTFRAAIERLDHLQALGITAIELMPVADFPGRRNWGYDGVLLYAPDSSYGRPEDLKALIDAAHARGIMVLLDVVYNHFGPEGNYLPAYAADMFTERHHTPWGAALNFDGSRSLPVREFVIHNALYWVQEFHVDGLRLDAVHAILDDGPEHLLDELARRVRELRPEIHLVLENEENQAARLRRDAAGTPRHFTAQWNDDLHHVLHAAATSEGSGYYADYLNDTHKLAVALAEGFVYQGQLMPFRGSARGEPSGALPPGAFVSFIQNHDQVGNRAFGERITALAAPEAVRAIVAVYLLLPQTPMLFMGEEWGSAQPFPFFCDFGAELADAVRRGRREEFAKFPEFHDPALRERIPDPQALSTFESARLVWEESSLPEHADWLELYRRLLHVRRDLIAPVLPLLRSGASSHASIGDGAVTVHWRWHGGELALAANLSAHPSAAFPRAAGRLVWRQGTVGEDGSFGPWAVRWTLSGPGD